MYLSRLFRAKTNVPVPFVFREEWTPPRFVEIPAHANSFAETAGATRVELAEEFAGAGPLWPAPALCVDRSA